MSHFQNGAMRAAWLAGMFYSSIGMMCGRCIRWRPQHEEGQKIAVVLPSYRNQRVFVEVWNMSDRFGPLTYVMVTAFISTLLWLSAMVGHFAR